MQRIGSNLDFDGWFGLGNNFAMDDERRTAILRDYALGQAGTRATIDKLGLHDFADLIIELAAADLPLPKPLDTPALAAHRERARSILIPRLTHGR